MTASRNALPTWLTRRLALRVLIGAGAAALLGAALLAAYLFLFIAPKLPALDVITDYRPKIPLRVYTADQVLIGEFGEEHRDFVAIKDVPEMMKKALLAIEDTEFYEHGGINYVRALGAAKANLGGGTRQGGSTITMQVARNFFLTRDKVYSRKVNEVMLAYKIEAALSKDQILELYMNQIYLGQRSYGFGSAAQTYFGKPLQQLSLAEMAMLAGLPQNPARHNPAVNPKRAAQRQRLVLKRLRELEYISAAQYEQALKEPLRVQPRGQQFDTHAEYVAELARQAVFAEFKEEAYTKGLKVYTTILKADQDAAYEAVRRNVLAYDQRHGYRGPEGFIDLPATPEEREEAIDEALQKRPLSDRLIAAVVTSVSPKKVTVDAGADEEIEIRGEGLRFAAAALGANAKAGVRLVPGALVRISQDGKKAWSIVQVPQVAAAFVAIDANTGAYHAMVGGFDYRLQQFNHVTQAWRQPGSAFKPFVYSAALEKGFSPATLISDAPLEMSGAEAGGQNWQPQNDDGKFEGPISMRFALAQSKNVASVRILRAVTVPFAHTFLEKFGFDPAKQPNNLTMALGTGAVTPGQLAGAYALFANGGFQVQPYLIGKVTDAQGAVVSATQAPEAGLETARGLDARNAYMVDNMLRDVVRSGTGAAATQRLGRGDIAGKTGTTSDAFDGWFAGYGGGIVGVAWMGFDEPKSLGGREFGATAALPIWIDYMKVALARRPQAERAVPAGLSRVDGDWVYDEFINNGEVRALDVAPDDMPAPPAAFPLETN
ncbi:MULTISPECIES: penicillin-binding protein 1A [unclassified Janthinobacterium]|uniref:penicillin-binding protein 1A n=1 Tax=unclassified Janthinobacterium TaxID=2610881 RepID=UPI000373BBCA|nr:MULTISPECIES: PBP1A family penicillin-binding protein [unclassified Janthinobacterium]MEC5161098.1 penicillin-binding protein 1A [Janthinobacterium sp. CG_S6]